MKFTKKKTRLQKRIRSYEETVAHVKNKSAYRRPGSTRR